MHRLHINSEHISAKESYQNFLDIRGSFSVKMLGTLKVKFSLSGEEKKMEEVVKLARNRWVWHSIVGKVTLHGTAVVVVVSLMVNGRKFDYHILEIVLLIF